jgi:TRAP-type C4-dicarboxylate transport system permease small subunit
LRVQRLSELYGRLLSSLAVLAAAMLFLMMLIICVDVLLRNIPVPQGIRGIAWSSDLTESMLYFLTILSAPWLLRKGQHIRIDIVLRTIPKRLAWYFEWLADVLAFTCCVLIALYGFSATVESARAGSLIIKTVVSKEWWSLAPMPVAFVLLAIEMLFRMHRLYHGERAPRQDSVSAS